MQDEPILPLPSTLVELGEALEALSSVPIFLSTKCAFELGYEIPEGLPIYQVENLAHLPNYPTNKSLYFDLSEPKQYGYPIPSEATLQRSLERLKRLGYRKAYMSRFLGREVWEFSAVNLPNYPEGVAAIYVPVGYHPSMERFRRPQERFQDIDVLFTGVAIERRRRIIDALKEAGLAARIVPHGTYGAERDALLARSKLALNLHFYTNPNLFESIRCAHLVANRVPLLSEDATDTAEWCSESAPYDRLVERAIELVRSSSARAELADRNYRLFREHPMRLPE